MWVRICAEVGGSDCRGGGSSKLPVPSSGGRGGSVSSVGLAGGRIGLGGASGRALLFLLVLPLAGYSFGARAYGRSDKSAG